MGQGNRIGRAAYWSQIVILFVAMMVLLAFAFGAFVAGRLPTALLCVALLLPAGIYFRVVQMRRCRDIDWPASLPWVIFGVLMLHTVTSFSSITSASQLLTGSAVSMALSLAGFVFMIVIGCVAGQRGAGYDPAAITGGSVTLRQEDGGSTGGSGDDRFDDAIARAMDNYRRTGSATSGRGGPVAAPMTPRPAVRPAAPRAAGFGRKGV